MLTVSPPPIAADPEPAPATSVRSLAGYARASAEALQRHQAERYRRGAGSAPWASGAEAATVVPLSAR